MFRFYGIVSFFFAALSFWCYTRGGAAQLCSTEVQQTWAVNDSTQVQALAEAVNNCSGGVFEVEWSGRVVLDEPLYVVDGTVLTITGTESNAVIDGNGITQLFNVIDATLRTSGVNITSGAAIDGGAISASGSTLILNQTNFIGNNAAGNGGAIYLSNRSTVSCGGEAVYANNQAGIDGGAMYVTGSSVSSCGGGWLDNIAGNSGGAVCVTTGSNFSWTGETATTQFINNNADTGSGGALFSFGSDVSWTGEKSTTKFADNTAGRDGGALHVNASTVTWGGGTATTQFINNRAFSGSGGAFSIFDSHVYWTGEEATTQFIENSARYAGVYGGAMYVSGSIVHWIGKSATTQFAGNGAHNYGGALYVESGSTVAWEGNTATTSFVNNTSQRTGAAVRVDDSNISWTGDLAMTQFIDNYSLGAALEIAESTVSWTGHGATTEFVNNSATDVSGGALSVTDSFVSWTGDNATTKLINNTSIVSGGALWAVNSNVSWTGDNATTQFIDNTAANNAGALLTTGSTVSWTGDNATTQFINNSAGIGGAVGLESGSVSFAGDTNFTSNVASVGNGGALVAVNAFGSTESSTLVLNGTATFFNNTSAANGGGLSILGSCNLTFGAGDVRFLENSAAIAGGAVFLAGTSVGPTFTDVTFSFNSAEIGGAASISGSGTEVTDTGAYPSPTRFLQCRFNDNQAATAGGAIHTASGQDNIGNCVFEGNSARTGGAVRLEGILQSIYNCSFLDNTSDDGQGAAVSNIGYISSVANISFSGNGFDCPSGTFLDWNETIDPSEAVCEACNISYDGRVFKDQVAPVCTTAIEHSTSSGLNTTLQSLTIEKGYWRHSVSSREVLACYHSDACGGGLTGSPDYCLEGYYGPYCSVCSEDFTEQLSFTCGKCSDIKNIGIAFVVIFAVVALAITAPIISYLMSGGGTVDAGRGIVERLTRYIPFQSVKIVIVVWQIVTQFTSVANVTYPSVYQDLLNALDIFNFDLSWILSVGCVVRTDFHDRLLVSTIGPIVGLMLLTCTYACALQIHQGSSQNLQSVWNKHVSMVLLLTFFVYSNVSAILFKAFACEQLGESIYLRSDYRIECDSPKHQAFKIYAGFMIVLYTVGIPTLYSGLLFRDRHLLKKDEADREDTPRVTSTSGLWKPYRPSVFYYEVFECGRRVLLAGVVVFIYPDTAAQIAVTLMIAFAFVIVSEALSPYSSKWDRWVNRMGHVVVFVSMFVALLLKVDVADEDASSQKVFESVLVAAHVCMVLVVVIEAIVLTCSLRG